MLAGSVGGGLLGADASRRGAWALWAEAQRGLTDAVAARLALHHGRVVSPSTSRTEPQAQGGLEAGLAYAIDVLRVVPSADLALGLDWVRGQSRHGAQATLAAGLGADYLVDRHLSVGLVLRGRQALFRLGGNDEIPLFRSLFVLVRVSATY